jgi:2-isopropylmalate synthase
MAETPDEEELFYDWNRVGFEGPLVEGRISLLDETLRDGIQSPSAVDPSVEDKKQILRYMARLGIRYADVGLPGAGKRAVEDVQALCETIRDERLPIHAGCAARTHPADIQPIIDLSKETGLRLEVLTFLGTSPIRQYAESWDLDKLEGLVATAVSMAVKAELPVAFVTEDTIRSSPKTLERLFRTAIDHGAERLVLCDTVGHATPDGIRALVEWTRDLVQRTGAKVGLDWHGHNDRGLARRERASTPPEYGRRSVSTGPRSASASA